MKSTTAEVNLLIVDDDRWLLESMVEWLQSEGFQVQTASSVADGKRKLSEHEFCLVLCDIRLGESDGMDLLKWVKKKAPQTPVMMMTGYAGPEAGSEVIAAGAFDLLTKPLIDQELLISIGRALDQTRITRENEQLKNQLDRRFGLENILSHDMRMTRIFDMIDSVADSRASVLITGENGTGKSMIARAIHQRSRRRSRPFIEVACGALPDNLLESELFGHVQGAFTGATSNKPGKFKLADTGTLFLDEIGTSSQALQVKLLRVLQELQFEQLGGSETISVDTRVVLATNENLEASVNEGKFRQDLFYRINVIRLELPSLRERVDDIPVLVEHFLQIAAKEYGREIDGFTPSAMQKLSEHNWPGNIRELENVVQRAVLLTKKPTIDSDLLPSSILQTSTVHVQGASLHADSTLSQNDSHSTAAASGLGIAVASRNATLSEALEVPERQIILETLKARNWNRNETATALGINRTTLYKKIKKLGIEELIPN
ncbi:MAG: sigma-54 dependent transcriptional regulator [Pirellulaceae bacterium]|nr:sigma-54 dependent transcriptional regulator [Pirellulaceae bacterium]